MAHYCIKAWRCEKKSWKIKEKLKGSWITYGKVEGQVQHLDQDKDAPSARWRVAVAVVYFLGFNFFA